MPDALGTPLVEDFQLDPATRERNEARTFKPEKHDDVCFACGRGLTKAAIDAGWWIHLVTDGSLATFNEVIDPAEDQGWFPLGSECARKVPRNYRGKFQQ